MRKNRLSILFLVLTVVCRPVVAQKKPAREVLRTPLEIVSPIENVADLEMELGQLKARLANVKKALQRNSEDIWRGTSQAVNGFTDATIGTLFVKSGEVEAIQETVKKSASAAAAAMVASEQAQTAFQSGNLKLAMAKTAEALARTQEQIANSDEAYDKTAKALTRVGGVLTGKLTPDQLKDLAHRYWESRKDLALSMRGFEIFEKAGDEHDVLVHLEGQLNSQFEQITILKLMQTYPSQIAGNSSNSQAQISIESQLIDNSDTAGESVQTASADKTAILNPATGKAPPTPAEIDNDLEETQPAKTTPPNSLGDDPYHGPSGLKVGIVTDPVLPSKIEILSQPQDPQENLHGVHGVVEEEITDDASGHVHDLGNISDEHDIRVDTSMIDNPPFRPDLVAAMDVEFSIQGEMVANSRSPFTFTFESSQPGEAKSATRGETFWKYLGIATDILNATNQIVTSIDDAKRRQSAKVQQPSKTSSRSVKATVPPSILTNKAPGTSQASKTASNATTTITAPTKTVSTTTTPKSDVPEIVSPPQSSDSFSFGSICSGRYMQNPLWNPYGAIHYNNNPGPDNYIPLCILKKN